MKNIHLLPIGLERDIKSPIIWEYPNTNEYRYSLHKEMNKEVGYNMYITSDEEIKEGDWFLWDDKGVTYLCKRNYTEVGLYHQDNGGVLEGIGISHESKATHTYIVYLKDCKKITLTTDPDLIADGVQVIDNEFLQWFIKHPTCEEVLTSLEENENGLVEYVIWKRYYTDRKPQEEPKQETLEEAAERLCLNIDRPIFKQGAKWQAERSYSDEEALDLLEKYSKHIQENFSPSKTVLSPKDWFEQNKKK